MRTVVCTASLAVGARAVNGILNLFLKIGVRTGFIHINNLRSLYSLHNRLLDK